MVYVYSNQISEVYVCMYVCMCSSVADEQHWQFQTYKHSLTAEQKKKDPSEDVKQGFYTKGKNEIFKMGTFVLYVHKELHTYIHIYIHTYQYPYGSSPIQVPIHHTYIHTFIHTTYIQNTNTYIHTYEHIHK